MAAAGAAVAEAAAVPEAEGAAAAEAAVWLEEAASVAAAAAPLASVGAAGAENKGRIYFCRINGFLLEISLILHKLGCSGAKTNEIQPYF